MAHWRDREINPSIPHGTDYWYRRGCRCDECSRWRNGEYRKTAEFYRRVRAMQGMNVHVPAGPTILRLRALARIGWSAREVAERAFGGAQLRSE